MSTLSVNTLQRQSGSNAPDGVRLLTAYSSTSTNRSLAGDSGWVSHLSGSVTLPKQSDVIVMANFSMTYESGAVQASCRMVWGGTAYDGFCMSKQSTANSGASASGAWNFQSQSAGTYTWDLQVRNVPGSTTCILNYWSPAGTGSGTDSVTIWYQG